MPVAFDVPGDGLSHTATLYPSTTTQGVLLVLAHGAGAGQSHPFMVRYARGLAERGLDVVTFDFPYMQTKRKSPDRAPVLEESFRRVISGAARHPQVAARKVFIGGKSMGGRVASMIADDLHASGKIVGLLCLGYPFHPPAKPEQLRTKHLAGLRTPTLICQGTRDEFGTCEEVQAYTLSDAIEVLWLEDGDHDLKPRKSISGFSTADHLRTVADAVAAWAARLTQ